MAGVVVLAGCGSAAAEQPGGRSAGEAGDRAIDAIAHGVALSMSDLRHYLDENLKADTSATAVARIADAHGDVLRASGDVYRHAGAVIVARFTASYDDSYGHQYTSVRCRRFVVTRSWWHVDVARVTCPSGPALVIAPDTRTWRKCPKVAIYRPVDAPEPCNPGG
jgi:hypothetical protein